MLHRSPALLQYIAYNGAMQAEDRQFTKISFERRFRKGYSGIHRAVRCDVNRAQANVATAVSDLRSRRDGLRQRPKYDQYDVDLSQKPLRKSDPKRRPHRDVVIVEVVAGVVHHACAGALAVTVADEEVAARKLFEHIGEILARGDRGGVPHGFVGADQIARDFSYAKRASASVFTSTG